MTACVLDAYAAGHLLVPDLSPTAPLLKNAFAIAATFERTIHDGIYVALAVHANLPLLTADERLANALAARFPIRWLGAL